MHQPLAVRQEGADAPHRPPQRRWKKTVTASSALLALTGTGLEAHAVILGNVTVRSALGEPLRAEIEVPQLTDTEAASFGAVVGSPQTFRAAGVTYAPALEGARLTLKRRPGGQAYLGLVSDKPIQDPLLAVVIEVSWSHGRIVRDYAMAVDAPVQLASRKNAPVVPRVEMPEVARDPVPERAPAPSASTTTTEPPVPAGRPAKPQEAPAHTVVAMEGPRLFKVRQGDTAYRIASAHLLGGGSVSQMLAALVRENPKAFVKGDVNRLRAGAVLSLPTAEPTVAAAPSAPTEDGAGAPTYVTQRGDTAYSIARSHLPAGVSLDQMMIALLRANPDAFVEDNLNLLRSGVTLTLPSAALAGAESPQAARRAVVAQARAFNAQRRAARSDQNAAEQVSAGPSGVNAVVASLTRARTLARQGDRQRASQAAHEATALLARLRHEAAAVVAAAAQRA